VQLVIFSKQQIEILTNSFSQITTKWNRETVNYRFQVTQQYIGNSLLNTKTINWKLCRDKKL